MHTNEIVNIYLLISTSIEKTAETNNLISVRKSRFLEIKSPGMIKVAFDTRRVNQELEYNPRRGLQNYHRSEQFLTEATSNKIKVFHKLLDLLEELKDTYEKEPEWQDSYCRVLFNTLQKGLRTEQKDGDYTEVQPGMGSLDYIEELLYVRYRLTPDLLEEMSGDKIKNKLLEKDEILTKKDINLIKNTSKIDNMSSSKQEYDTLLEKLFGGVKADKNNKSVERTVTITIKDTYLDEDK